jgi:hypothetical protein
VHYLHFIAIADLPLPTGRASLNDDNLKHRLRKYRHSANIPLRLIKHAKIKAPRFWDEPDQPGRSGDFCSSGKTGSAEPVVKR